MPFSGVCGAVQNLLKIYWRKYETNPRWSEPIWTSRTFLVPDKRLTTIGNTFSRQVTSTIVKKELLSDLQDFFDEDTEDYYYQNGTP
jgi:hypothetical protein